MGDALGEVVEIDPALGLFFELFFEGFLLGKQLLKPDIIAGAGGDGRLAVGDLCFQSGDVRVDGVELALLLEAEVQLLGAIGAAFSGRGVRRLLLGT